MSNNQRDQQFIAFMYLKIQESMNKLISDVELLKYLSDKDESNYIIPDELKNIVACKKSLRRRLRYQRNRRLY